MILRLQKLMAERGIASRRQSEKLIVEGKVKVNGVKTTVLGTKVDTLKDVVSVKGVMINNPRKKKENREKDNKGQIVEVRKSGKISPEKVPNGGREITNKVPKKSLISDRGAKPRIVDEAPDKVYLMLNKPTGFVTTAHDELGRKTIFELLREAEAKYGGRLFAVGRLDADTSGLLLITNDGDWANQVTHPRYEIVKTYVALVSGGEWSTNETSRFTSGLRLGSKATKLTAPADLRILERRDNGTRKVEIKIAEGQNHQVRRMCLAVNHPVLKLERVAVGGLKLGDLKKGKWRELTKAEVEKVTEVSGEKLGKEVRRLPSKTS